ncbi:hypothetical protein FIBSPDRAFT_861759 [Athelia psychrophila]|uniref:PH domain-containing protein n=1 Tax=Athelia psychrophila TaxID=1759441 RepID=A0A166IWG5_9AGAM|nr:hypothetical protein FIBSPDRAFT_861759 [Fibularhizoctonia sp. CBS 109695]
MYGDFEDGPGSGEGSYLEDGDSMSEGTSTYDLRLPARSKSFVDRWQSHPQRTSDPSSAAMSTGNRISQSSQYTLLSFSNAHIFEDSFVLSSYSLRPYELLELHPARCIIQLPRDAVSLYVQPYFEARVDALRNMTKDKAEGFLGRVNLGSSSKRNALGIKIGSQKGVLYGSEPGVSTDYTRQQRSWEEEQVKEKNDKHERAHAKKGQDNGQKKRKMEWKQRWIVIHEGKVRLSQHRADTSNTRTFSLDSIIAIRGAEHLPKPYANMASSQHIICVKFRQEGVTPAVKAIPSPLIPTPDKDALSASMPSTRQPSPAPRIRESYHHYRPLPIDEHNPLNEPPQQQQHRGVQTLTSPPSSFIDSTLSPSRSNASISLSGSLSGSVKSRHTSNSSIQELDASMGTATGMATGIWGMTGHMDTNRSFSVGTPTSVSSASTSRSVSVGTGPRERGEAEEEWNKIEKEKEKADEVGEWIVLDICDDGAYTALLRILHRHTPRPISSTFLPKTTTPSANISSPSSVKLINTTSPKQSVHFPGTPSSPIAFTSPFGSGSPPSSAQDAPWNVPVAYSSGTSGGDYLFGTGYLAPSGAQQYPEWRTRLVGRARKVGVGDIGVAKEWVMWGKDVEELAEVNDKEDTETEDNAFVGRKRRDTIGTLASVANDGTIGLAISSPPPSPAPSTHRRDDTDEDEDETLSDYEWEGWMRDLDRQFEVEEEARRRKLKPRRDPSILSSRSSSDSLHYRPRALTLSTAPTSPLPSSSFLSPDTGYPSHPPGSPIGLSASPTRRRSSTVTAASSGSRLLRKKEKGKERERELPPPLPNLPVNLVQATSPDKPKLHLAVSDIGHSLGPLSALLKADQDDISELPASDPHPRRTALLRHVRSASNLQRSLRGEKDRNILRDQEGLSASTSNIAGEISESSVATVAPTERKGGLRGRLVRGLDSALDFVTT